MPKIKNNSARLLIFFPKDVELRLIPTREEEISDDEAKELASNFVFSALCDLSDISCTGFKTEWFTHKATKTDPIPRLEPVKTTAKSEQIEAEEQAEENAENENAEAGSEGIPTDAILKGSAGDAKDAIALIENVELLSDLAKNEVRPTVREAIRTRLEELI